MVVVRRRAVEEPSEGPQLQRVLLLRAELGDGHDVRAARHRVVDAAGEGGGVARWVDHRHRASPQRGDVSTRPRRVGHHHVAGASRSAIGDRKQAVVRHLDGAERPTARHRRRVVVRRGAATHARQHVRADRRVVDVRGRQTPAHQPEDRQGECVAHRVNVDVGHETTTERSAHGWQRPHPQGRRKKIYFADKIPAGSIGFVHVWK